MAIFSVDILIFSTLTFIYMKLKKNKPDWFFPTAGFQFFLPPEESDLKELRQEKELSQKKMNSFQKKKFSVNIKFIFVFQIYCRGNPLCL